MKLDFLTIIAGKSRQTCAQGNRNGKESAEEFLTIWIIDTETGTTEKRKISFTKNPWLNDHRQPYDNIVPPPETIKKNVWKRGANDKDILVVPQLLEKVER